MATRQAGLGEKVRKVILNTYVQIHQETGLFPDGMVVNQAAASRFAELVRQVFPDRDDLSVERVSKELLNMRRKGLLPRFGREYNGRTVNKPR